MFFLRKSYCCLRISILKSNLMGSEIILRSYTLFAAPMIQILKKIIVRKQESFCGTKPIWYLPCKRQMVFEGKFVRTGNTKYITRLHSHYSTYLDRL